MARHIDKAARADLAADAALAMFLEQPREAVTIEALAERAGLTYWQVHRFHGNAGNLFRAAIARLIQKVESRLNSAPSDALSMNEGIRRYTAFAAEVMQDEAYAQFVYLLIRDRHVEPMLEEAYDGRIAGPLRRGLEKLVRSFGLDRDMMILLGANSSWEFVKSLEAEFVLPRLLPGFVPPNPETVNAAVRRIADRVTTASYVLGSQAA